MRAIAKDDILYIHHEDVPVYKKGGSVVRNSYFWALKSIACGARRGQDWEFDAEVWVALVRMLLCFANSGYLGDGETILEFTVDCPIPEPLRGISTYF
ncbi:hypothetical protein NIES3806_13790 [Microcystis aeruginosa NIES-3806]|uniref:Uncharacterized protein n=3 Tax=Microcystis aeruginosa TaxID=1126 RepID=A0A0F6U6W9_MICAE|nr:hypothetical protein [Microcystis aeruginosa]AKE65884.1 hypothetical protein MYAER_3546 [Microcystis aeruginosa NIES-2549]AOC54290.1 hypothetical protein amyaer_3587 [Microcystis aeruginosa NIES-2481]GCA79022.1 hypothetical protein MiTs_01009 [Microcystis aeruginosa NIES-2521]GCL54042.1 hypothetical protein NIES3806_13790 [Microcystis aeruginosa NIES-3806]GCL60488.1 hypothetical protein NIES3807_36730 [Microcystis aeruginosa NIES-3807]